MNMLNKQTSIPVLMIQGQNLAHVWECAVMETWRRGRPIKTQYDKPGDEPSRDCTMMMVVEDPLAEPMIHRDFPGGLEDLQEYCMEVIDGIKDHLVRDQKDVNDHRWEYTYHQRLFSFAAQGQIYDQIRIMATKLAENPHTRRAQAVTWKVWEDNDCYDPACLQSIWCRIVVDNNDMWWLNTNVRFRSNDAYKAAFMNMFALTKLQQLIAATVSDMTKRPVQLGRYVHQADSFHIYGSYFKEFEERFLKSFVRRPDFTDRTMRYADVKEMMDEAIPRIQAKARDMG
jgi:thymidylate synthase